MSVWFRLNRVNGRLQWAKTAAEGKKEKLTDATCLLYTSDAADEEDSGDIGGRRRNKKKKNKYTVFCLKTEFEKEGTSGNKAV